MATRSLVTRFFKTFWKKFFNTMHESLFDKSVVVAALVYIVTRGLLTERWEFVSTVVGGLCIVIVAHAFKAAKEVSKEIQEEKRHESAKGFAPAPDITYPSFYKLRLYTIPCLLLAICGYCTYILWSKENRRHNTFSLVGVEWDHQIVNAKGPCAEKPTQRNLPNGACQIILPPGIGGTALHSEVKMTNTGDSKAEDVYWHGGVVVSDDLDDAGEDILFGKLTAQSIATWSEFEVGETRTLTIRNDNPTRWDTNKVRYLMLRGSFHDESGKRPDVEFCKRYGGRGKSMFEADHLDEFCKGHNVGVDRTKPPS